MSYANGTTNYNLPQTVGTDKRDWSDTNQAFHDVDEALKAASDGAAQAAEDITSLTTRIGTAEDDILALKGEDISLDGRLDTAEGAISTLQLQVPDVRSDLEDMITAFNEASATSTHAYSEGDYFIYNDVLYKATTSIGIGDTIVPNTNCSATNVMTEIGTGAAAPTAAEVSLAPITGMTADDVQEGIEELKSALPDSQDISRITANRLTTSQSITTTTVLTSDGYLEILANANELCDVYVKGAGTNDLRFRLREYGDNTQSRRVTTFVKKGMEVSIQQVDASSTVTFFPLTN